jgi:cupin fold WbuC family metalloprotein
MKIIDEVLLNEVAARAKTSPRLRMNHNFHERPEDPVNRLLNAMEPGTYVRPHRHLHPPKDESFLVLRGKAVLLIFDEAGNVTERALLDPAAGVYGADLPAGVWHGLSVLEPDTVLYEVKNGPFVPVPPEDAAPWSPAPEDTEGVRRFMETYR